MLFERIGECRIGKTGLRLRCGNRGCRFIRILAKEIDRSVSAIWWQGHYCKTIFVLSLLLSYFCTRQILVIIMKWESFVARRIYSDKDNRREVSPPAVRLAIAGVALGLAVMILTVAIVVGFKQEIREKVVGFGSHIRISAFSSNTTYETPPIQFSDRLSQLLSDDEEIVRIEPYATKPGIFKTDDHYMGIVMKGVMPGYDWSFFASYLTEGSLPQLTDSIVSDRILISQAIASKLGIKAGDDVLAYFVQDEAVRARKFIVEGIYKTDLSDFDNLFVIGDTRQVQRLNAWYPDQYSGVELRVAHYDKLDDTTYRLYTQLLMTPDKYGQHYYTQSVQELNPVFFGWLDLLDMNVWVIIILMSVVAGFTMISGLLVIILENASMIGVLKSLGASNRSIRTIFLNLSAFLVGKGLLWGNVVGVTLCLVQKYFHLLKLNPEAYYIPYVPIELNVWHVVLLNVGSLIVSMLMLVGPSYIVALIRPAQTVKYE